MSASCDLRSKRCEPCEGKVAPLASSEAATLLAQIPEWSLVEGGQRIRRHWRMEDFPAAIEFFRRVAAIAESEGHHPDLHLTQYRNVDIELWTHAANGLTENDFILAAKIDHLS